MGCTLEVESFISMPKPYSKYVAPSFSRPHCARSLESILQLACSTVEGGQPSRCQLGDSLRLYLR